MSHEEEMFPKLRPYYVHPTGGVPKRVIVLALGPSTLEYVNAHLSKGHPLGDRGPGGSDEADEVWTLNRGISIYPHDLCFVLDDLRNEATLDPDYMRAVRQSDAPVLTTTPYPEYPNAREYPLRDVCEMLTQTHCYLDNSLPMVIAYAKLIGVEELTLFGADFTGGGAVLEQNRANTEYMIAWARCNGMQVGTTTASSLTNANRPRPHVYGFLGSPPAFVHWLRSGTWPDEIWHDPCYPEREGVRENGPDHLADYRQGEQVMSRMRAAAYRCIKCREVLPYHAEGCELADEEPGEVDDD